MMPGVTHLPASITTAPAGPGKLSPPTAMIASPRRSPCHRRSAAVAVEHGRMTDHGRRGGVALSRSREGICVDPHRRGGLGLAYAAAEEPTSKWPGKGTAAKSRRIWLGLALEVGATRPARQAPRGRRAMSSSVSRCIHFWTKGDNSQDCNADADRDPAEQLNRCCPARTCPWSFRRHAHPSPRRSCLPGNCRPPSYRTRRP